MPRKKLSDDRLLELVAEGLNSRQIGEKVGISRQGVEKRLKKLKVATSKVVATTPAAKKMVTHQFDAIEQYMAINQYDNDLLDLVMDSIRGDKRAAIELEKKVFDVSHPYSLALKSMAEIRGQIKLQLELSQAIYDVKAVRELDEEEAKVLEPVN